MKRAAAAAVAVAAVAAGCGEAPDQRGAREAVQAFTGAAGGDVHCTRPETGILGVGPRATAFVCTRRTSPGICDLYVATRRGRDFRVRLQRRGADCLLPAA